MPLEPAVAVEATAAVVAVTTLVIWGKVALGLEDIISLGEVDLGEDTAVTTKPGFGGWIMLEVIATLEGDDW